MRLTAAGPEARATELELAKERAVGERVLAFAAQRFAAGGTGGVCAQKRSGLQFQERPLGRLQQYFGLREGQAQLFDLFTRLVEHGDIDHVVCLPIARMGDELKFELHVDDLLLRPDLWRYRAGSLHAARLVAPGF